MVPHMGRRPQGDHAMTNTERWRRWYAKQHPTKPNDMPAEAEQTIAQLRAELAAANARIAELLTLGWSILGIGDGRWFSQATVQAGTYFVGWQATREPPCGGENRRRTPPEGDTFDAHFSPFAKDGRRRLKDRPLGTFPTLYEARAACQEHARAQKV
jgi:hypothetical protein